MASPPAHDQTGVRKHTSNGVSERGTHVGIFDDAEKLVNQDEVQDVTQDAEKLADQKTGDKFDSEVTDAGNMADKEIDQDLGQQQQQQ